MKLKSLVLLSAGVLLSTAALAQRDIDESEQAVIYKWYENGIAHYAKTPPYNNDNYTRLNDQGMVIKDRPDLDSYNRIKPVRPESGAGEDKPVSSTQESKPQETVAVEGMITREQRCQDARKNITMISQNTTIYEEDNDGNLIPLSQQIIDKRLAEAKADEARFCN